MAQLEKLINKVDDPFRVISKQSGCYLQDYKDTERSTFLHQTLPKMCDLVLNLRSMFKEVLTRNSSIKTAFISHLL